jgi:aerobic-type carbon monoxide dehydrogenase small subunit (CoxS/CutS family)
VRRRALLAAVPSLAVPLSGCSAGPPTAGVDDTGFRTTGDCRANDAATVAVDGSDVAVEGCVVGANGCADARLAAATLDGAALTVVVESFVPDDAEACTQALVGRAYRATVGLDAPPESVRVVHRGVDDGTVATWP